MHSQEDHHRSDQLPMLIPSDDDDTVVEQRTRSQALIMPHFVMEMQHAGAPPQVPDLLAQVPAVRDRWSPSGFYGPDFQFQWWPVTSTETHDAGEAQLDSSDRAAALSNEDPRHRGDVSSVDELHPSWEHDWHAVYGEDHSHMYLVDSERHTYMYVRQPEPLLFTALEFETIGGRECRSWPIPAAASSGDAGGRVAVEAKWFLYHRHDCIPSVVDAMRLFIQKDSSMVSAVQLPRIRDAGRVSENLATQGGDAKEGLAAQGITTMPWGFALPSGQIVRSFCIPWWHGTRNPELDEFRSQRRSVFSRVAQHLGLDAGAPSHLVAANYSGKAELFTSDDVSCDESDTLFESLQFGTTPPLTSVGSPPSGVLNGREEKNTAAASVLLGYAHRLSRHQHAIVACCKRHIEESLERRSRASQSGVTLHGDGEDTVEETRGDFLFGSSSQPNSPSVDDTVTAAFPTTLPAPLALPSDTFCAMPITSDGSLDAPFSCCATQARTLCVDVWTAVLHQYTPQSTQRKLRLVCSLFNNLLTSPCVLWEHRLPSFFVSDALEEQLQSRCVVHRMLAASSTGKLPAEYMLCRARCMKGCCHEAWRLNYIIEHRIQQQEADDVQDYVLSAALVKSITFPDVSASPSRNTGRLACSSDYITWLTCFMVVLIATLTLIQLFLSRDSIVAADARGGGPPQNRPADASHYFPMWIAFGLSYPLVYRFFYCSTGETCVIGVLQVIGLQLSILLMYFFRIVSPSATALACVTPLLIAMASLVAVCCANIRQQYVYVRSLGHGRARTLAASNVPRLESTMFNVAALVDDSNDAVETPPRSLPEHDGSREFGVARWLMFLSELRSSVASRLPSYYVCVYGIQIALLLSAMGIPALFAMEMDGVLRIGEEEISPVVNFVSQLNATWNAEPQGVRVRLTGVPILMFALSAGFLLSVPVLRLGRKSSTSPTITPARSPLLYASMVGYLLSGCGICTAIGLRLIVGGPAPAVSEFVYAMLITFVAVLAAATLCNVLSGSTLSFSCTSRSASVMHSFDDFEEESELRRMFYYTA